MTELKNVTSYGNSGAGAIALAIAGGAKRIIMIGYDCKKTDGKAHWHADYPKAMGNAGMIDKWQSRFQQLKDDNPEVEIINATRDTALTCFDKMTLEEALSLPPL